MLRRPALPCTAPGFGDDLRVQSECFGASGLFGAGGVADHREAPSPDGGRGGRIVRVCGGNDNHLFVCGLGCNIPTLL